MNCIFFGKCLRQQNNDEMLDSNENNLLSKEAIDNLLQQIVQDKNDKK